MVLFRRGFGSHYSTEQKEKMRVAFSLFVLLEKILSYFISKDFQYYL